MLKTWIETNQRNFAIDAREIVNVKNELFRNEYLRTAWIEYAPDTFVEINFLRSEYNAV